MSSTTEEIPETMKRLVVVEPGKDVASCKIEIQEIPVPPLKKGEYLVKMVAAPVNPSDYGSWFRARPNQCPYAMGKEGCGIIVKTGGGFTSSLLGHKIGTPVGLIGLGNKQGTYSEYVVADYTKMFPMPKDLPIEDAASFFINPYTTIGIVETVKKTGAKAFVHTAAASQLGQMMVKYMQQEEPEMELINVVRRQEQADLLTELGAKHVVITSNEDWKDTLKSKIDELGATVAMDAVAGSMTGDLIKVLPNNGTVYVYGGLGGLVQNVDPMDLIYKQKTVKGFILNDWIMDGGMLYMFPRMIGAGKKVNSGLAEGGWSSSQFKDTTMSNVQTDLTALLDGTSTGVKLRVRF